MISIIVPAHNESAVIEHTLSTLLRGLPADAEVLVVANGCSDDTAERARAVGGMVRVIETPIGGKVHALGLGDQKARGFPRFYVDADVLLTGSAVGEMAKCIEAEGLPAASPELRMDLSRSSLPVRGYYRLWTQLPYVREGMIGVGVYALSREGRARFGNFPAITNDDGYVRLLFEPHERPVIAGCVSTVTPPRSLRGLVMIKTRSRSGNRELRGRFPELFERQQSRKRHGGSLLQTVRASGRWLDVPSYLLVTLLAAANARLRGRRAGTAWERDDSSRATLASG